MQSGNIASTKGIVIRRREMKTLLDISPLNAPLVHVHAPRGSPYLQGMHGAWSTKQVKRPESTLLGPDMLSFLLISIEKVSMQRPQNSHSGSGTHPETSQGCPRKRVSGMSISSRPELEGKRTECFVGRFRVLCYPGRFIGPTTAFRLVLRLLLYLAGSLKISI